MLRTLLKRATSTVCVPARCPWVYRAPTVAVCRAAQGSWVQRPPSVCPAQPTFKVTTPQWNYARWVVLPLLPNRPPPPPVKNDFVTIIVAFIIASAVCLCVGYVQVLLLLPWPWALLLLGVTGLVINECYKSIYCH